MAFSYFPRLVNPFRQMHILTSHLEKPFFFDGFLILCCGTVIKNSRRLDLLITKIHLYRMSVNSPNPFPVFAELIPLFVLSECHLMEFFFR